MSTKFFSSNLNKFIIKFGDEREKSIFFIDSYNENYPSIDLFLDNYSSLKSVSM